jgi:ADP-ribose pyrophosphatase
VRAALMPWQPLRMVEAWKLLDEQPGSAGYLPVVNRRYRLPDGSRGEWDIFGPEQTVAVLAITADDEIVLARQYRPGPDCILDELPGGLVEPGEDVAEAARRELLEETGFSGDLAVVARSWLASACRTRRFVAITRNAKQIAKPSNDPSEFCDVVLAPLAQFRDHLRSGQLTDVDLGYLALEHLGLLA